jgi:hypothetical protein
VCADNNIASAVAFGGKVYVMTNRGDVFSTEESGDPVDLAQAMLVGSNTSAIFVGKDRLYMKIGGDVFESGNRLEKARRNIINAKSNSL